MSYLISDLEQLRSDYLMTRMQGTNAEPPRDLIHHMRAVDGYGPVFKRATSGMYHGGMAGTRGYVPNRYLQSPILLQIFTT